jgi:hypothetical protein
MDGVVPNEPVIGSKNGQCAQCNIQTVMHHLLPMHSSTASPMQRVDHQSTREYNFAAYPYSSPSTSIPSFHMREQATTAAVPIQATNNLASCCSGHPPTLKQAHNGHTHLCSSSLYNCYQLSLHFANPCSEAIPSSVAQCRMHSQLPCRV